MLYKILYVNNGTKIQIELSLYFSLPEAFEPLAGTLLVTVRLQRKVKTHFGGSATQHLTQKED